MQYVVSTPLLAAQSQAGWGAGVTFPGGLCSLGTFPPEVPTSFGLSAAAPLLHSACCGEKGRRDLILAEITGVQLESYTIPMDCQ